MSASPVPRKPNYATCVTHDRPICPPCLFNCQRVDLDLTSSSLVIQDGLQVYMAYPRQVLFTWSEQRADLRKLDALADLSRSNEFEKYTVVENAGWSPLFVPQLDEQVKGVDVWDYFRQYCYMEFKRPVPDSPDTFGSVWCSECQLTWLKGETNNGPANINTHPRHQTLPVDLAQVRYLDYRSLIIHIDGVLPKGQSTGPVNAGIGVFFGEDSRYNLSEPFAIRRNSQHRAALRAAQRALETVRDDVIPEWLAALEEAKAASMYNHMRVIIATKSEALVNIFTKRIQEWKWDRVSHQYLRSGNRPANRRLQDIRSRCRNSLVPRGQEVQQRSKAFGEYLRWGVCNTKLRPGVFCYSRC
ncbi:hypothetical protein GGR52DRAFT_431156 [Hypoxylon sp. FL1284]|nr:hypothetical protein GGR52DRAFT_431156 [Hypoxylon sp. FL1284]